MDPALWEEFREDADDEVEAIVRLTHQTASIPGVRIVSRFGNIATCRLPRASILEVRNDENVVSLKASRLVAPEKPILEDQFTPEMFKKDERRPSDLLPTGKGVVLGILDFGVDPLTESFREPNGNSRLLAVWDQRAQPRDGENNSYGYGRIFNRHALNTALRSRNPYEFLNYHPGRGAHGTHVLDIAAGNGRHGGPLGIAPQCDLVVVHLSNRGTGGLASLADSVKVLEGVDYVRQIAGNRPFCINLSIGRHGGSHDGTSPFDLALDAFLREAPGRCLSQSAGNYGFTSTAAHSSKILHAGQTVTLRLLVDPADITPNEVEVFYDASEFSVMLESPDGRHSSWVPLNEMGELQRHGTVLARIYNRKSDPNNPATNHIDCFIYPGAPGGEWRLHLHADITPPQGSVFHAWVERDDACPRCQARFHPEDVDTTCTIGTLATGKHPGIVVGAYDAHASNKPIAPFSSSGPTRDGRQKPDLVAPGVQILAARSAPPSNGSALVRKSGTSMASPHVAGAAALLMEVGGAKLWASDIRDLILSNVGPVSSTADPNRFGQGYLNIQMAVDAAIKFMRRGDPKRRFLYITSSDGTEAVRPISTNGVALNFESEQIQDTGRDNCLSDHIDDLLFQDEADLENSSKRNFILISGGPGLFDDSDIEHDRSWANYVTPPLLLTDSKRKLADFVDPEEEVWWLIYKPAYQKRWEDDHQHGRAAVKEVKDEGFSSYVDLLEKRAKSRNWNLRWFDSADDLWRSFRTFKNPISRVWYWGHGRKDLWLTFPVKLRNHEVVSVSSVAKNRKLRSKFKKNGEASVHRFIGCNTRDFAEAWSNTFGVSAEGIDGKVEFRDIHGTGGEPTLVGKAKKIRFSPDDADADGLPADENDLSLPNSVLAQAEALLSRHLKPSETELLNALLGPDKESKFAPFRSPDALFRSLLSDIPNLPPNVEILALPEQLLAKPLQEGDLLLRVALGESGLGHIAVIANPVLVPSTQLHQTSFSSEGRLPGFYAHVIEAGGSPHVSLSNFTRRVLGANGKVPHGQLILRNVQSSPKSVLESAADEYGLESGSIPLPTGTPKAPDQRSAPVPLIKTLPEIGRYSGRRVPDHLISGFKATLRELFLLVRVHSEGAVRNLHFRPASDVDFRKKNAAIRKLLTFDQKHAGFLSSLNEELGGGRSYPILTGLLGIGTSIASAGAGLLFSVATALIDAAREVQPVMAREGDEIWQIEQVGTVKCNIVHVEYFVLWDPYRRQANVPSKWIIHEERRNVIV